MMDMCVLGMAHGQILHSQVQEKFTSVTSQHQEGGDPGRRKGTIHHIL